MSMESNMIHTCVIERTIVEDENPLGGPGSSTVVTVYSGICRLVEKAQRVKNDETATWEVIAVYKLFLPAGLNLQDRDNVASITLEDATELVNAFKVTQSLTRRGLIARFISVDLEKVK